MSMTSKVDNKRRVTLKRNPHAAPGYVVWDVFWDGELIGTVTRTGESRDSYPWDWAVSGDKWHGRRGSGVADIRRNAVETLVYAATGETVWY